MNNLVERANVVQTYRDGKCGICRDDFSPEDQQFTHTGGEGHDGFHRECLVSWLRFNAACPYDQQEIDPNAILTRMERISAGIERITQNLKSALTDAAIGVFFGVTAAGLAAIGAGVVAEAAVRVMPAVEAKMRGMPAVAAWGVGLGVVSLLRAMPAAAAVGLVIGVGGAIVAEATGVEVIGVGLALGAAAIQVAGWVPGEEIARVAAER